MNPLMIGALAFVALIVLLCLRVPIAISMLIVGSGGLMLTKGAALAFYSLSNTPYSALLSFSMCTIPLFILMGIAILVKQCFLFLRCRCTEPACYRICIPAAMFQGNQTPVKLILLADSFL